jgi:hypothetical protein
MVENGKRVPGTRNLLSRIPIVFRGGTKRIRYTLNKRVSEIFWFNKYFYTFFNKNLFFNIFFTILNKNRYDKPESLRQSYRVNCFFSVNSQE